MQFVCLRLSAAPTTASTLDAKQGHKPHRSVHYTICTYGNMGEKPTHCTWYGFCYICCEGPHVENQTVCECLLE